MSRNYSGEGHVIDVTLVAVAVAGVAFAVGNLLVVPVTDGAIGDTIACSMQGVFNIPKADPAVINQGEDIVFVVGTGLIDDNTGIPLAGDLSLGCVAMETKGATVGESILVKINQGVNTVT